MKRFVTLVALMATTTLGTANVASAADFSLSEPFDKVGALGSRWVATGTVIPAVVADNSQTPSKALQLTSAENDQRGFVLYDRSIPVTQGLDIRFTSAQWGGDGGADGISFFIKDAADTDTDPGSGGGGLGYAPDTILLTEGISGALLGVGLDGYGNFDEDRNEGSDCNHSEFTNFDWPEYRNTLVVRGPGQGLTGYCRLADTVRLSVEGLPDLVGANRADAARHVRVTIDPANIDDPRVKVYYEGELVFDIAEPAEIAGVSGIKLGFSAGTGGETDHHDIWGLTVESLIKTEGEERLAATGGTEFTGLGALAAAGALLVTAVVIRRQRSR